MCSEVNEIKKAYLKRYLASKRREEELRLSLEALETEYGLHSPRLDDMPHGSNHSDLSDFAARYDKEYTALIRILGESLKIYGEITQAIEDSDCNETETCVLRYRYIHGYTWERIAVTMDYSYQWVCELHGRALSHFKIPQSLDSN